MAHSSPTPFSPASPLTSPTDDLRRAAELGSMLLRRNGELESFAAGLTEELATARSQISNQAVKITEYEGKCSELANRIDELIRDSVNASTARVKALESERSSLRASLDDARTVIAFLSSERETLTSVNADLKMQLSSRKCVNTPVDSTLAVVTKGATAAAPQPAPADQHTTIAALRSDVSVLYDQVKDFQARNKGLEAALAAKDEDIMSLQAVISRQAEEALEQREVMQSFRRESGPATPSRAVTVRNNAPMFSVSPTTDPGWWDNDPVVQQCDDSYHTDASMIIPPTAFTDTIDVSVTQLDEEERQENLPYFPSLEAFHTGIPSAVTPSTKRTSVMLASTSTTFAKPPLAPTSSVLNMFNTLSNKLSSKPSNRLTSGSENAAPAPPQSRAAVPKGTALMRTLSDMTTNSFGKVRRLTGRM